MSDSKLIDELGGTGAVAKICAVKPPSVSEWRIRGIPKARLMYLSALSKSDQKVKAAFERAGRERDTFALTPSAIHQERAA